MTEPADVVIVNGRVFDGTIRTDSTAVAVSEDRIVRVGSDAHVGQLQGDRTRVLDAAGGLIHPGFVDAHAHAAFAGVERLSIDLSRARTVDETLELIRAGAERSDAEWLTGGGWNHDLFPLPTRQQLDALVPDRPVALSDNGHHTLWVKSKALGIAGVDRSTPQPHNGHIHLDDAGDPIGYLNETAAELVGRVDPARHRRRDLRRVAECSGLPVVVGCHRLARGDPGRLQREGRLHLRLPALKSPTGRCAVRRPERCGSRPVFGSRTFPRSWPASSSCGHATPRRASTPRRRKR